MEVTFGLSNWLSNFEDHDRKSLDCTETAHEEKYGC